MMSRPLVLTAVLSALVLPIRASAQRCDAPRVMLTVDRSSSMLGVLPDGNTKWDAAVMAIGEITLAYEGRIDFGLQPFPYPNRCEPGQVVLDMGPHTSDEIVEALGGPPPSGGNWTPMAQTLDVAAEHPGLRDATRTRHLILVTDGWQWCDPYSPSTRFTPVESVQRLRDLGVTVHVVGFGAAVDSLTLNRAAVAAGTALPGCDATLSDPAAENHCYVQADDLTELRGALEEIARLVTEEVCDGDDDDCDGRIDEGYDVDGDGVTTCGGDCDDADARVLPGAAEVCDGVDNECDGTTDPGCECLVGEERTCGSDVGACSTGVQRCVDGAWAACEGAVDPVAETCNGVDEDCDGAIDENADASCGEGRACTADGCIDITPSPGPTPEMPPVDEERGEPRGPREPGMQAGCACSAAGASQPGLPLAPIGLGAFAIAVALVRRRLR